MDNSDLSQDELAAVNQFKKELLRYPLSHVANFLGVYSESARRHQLAVDPTSREQVPGSGLTSAEIQQLTSDELIELTASAFAAGIIWYRKWREVSEARERLKKAFALNI
jgi:hypothetical protein